MTKGYVHSIESLGTVDGPGIRTVVFMQGCHLRCRYCHNPDTWSCHGGKVFSAEELYNKIKNFRHYYKKTGGVTVSGGEPLIQAEFLYEFFEILKDNNIHRAIDTAGLLNDETKKLLTITDLVLLDIKHTDYDEYKKLTGNNLDITLDFYDYLVKTNVPFWIRQVIVSGINDTEEQVAELARYAAKAQKVELIPYHTMGIAKWDKLKIPYSLKDIEPPTLAKMEQLRKVLDEQMQKIN